MEPLAKVDVKEKLLNESDDKGVSGTAATSVVLLVFYSFTLVSVAYSLYLGSAEALGEQWYNVLSFVAMAQAVLSLLVASFIFPLSLLTACVFLTAKRDGDLVSIRKSAKTYVKLESRKMKIKKAFYIALNLLLFIGLAALGWYWVACIWFAGWVMVKASGILISSSVNDFLSNLTPEQARDLINAKA